MYCTKCGKEIPDDSNVCQFCGVNVRENEEIVNFVKEAEKDDEHVSMGQWLGIMALGFIPCVGTLIYTIMLFIWGFGDTKKKSLKTFSRAALIMVAISIVLTIILSAVFIIMAEGLVEFLGESPIMYY